MKVNEIPCTFYGDDGHHEDKEIELGKPKNETLVDVYECDCGVQIEKIYYQEYVGNRYTDKGNYSEDF